MNKVYRSLLLIAAAVSIIGNDSVAVEEEKGFSPQYLGAGAGVAFTEGASETEAAILAAYRTPGINTPITIRGALFPRNGVEGQVSLTYDFGVAKNTNLYVGPGVFAGAGEFYPTVGAGAEYLFDKANTVVFASYDRVFIEGRGINLAKAGVGYQF
jgi:hypothetical protein